MGDWLPALVIVGSVVTANFAISAAARSHRHRHLTEEDPRGPFGGEG